MKTRKKKHLWILLFAIFLQKKAVSQNQVPATFFGHNFWETNYSGAPSGSITDLSATNWSYVTATGAKMIRVGGNNYDIYTNGRYPHTGSGASSTVTSEGYVKIVDDIRANGFEPMITVPFDWKSQTKSIASQAAVAAEIVRQLNVVHHRNVKYFIIANEPGQDQGIYNSSSGDPTNPTDDDVRLIRNYIKKYSYEMKSIDPSIQIIGPELEWHHYSILNRLFASTSTGSFSTFSIRGTFGSTFESLPTPVAIASLNIVDVLSFHSYPSSGGAFTTYSANTRKAIIEAGYDYRYNYQNIYDSLIICPTNTVENRIGTLKVGVDELNGLGYDFAGSHSLSAITNTDISDDANKHPNSFIAGQMLVDLMASMLAVKEGTNGTTPFSFANAWSINESRSTSLIHSGGVRKPTYWHYYLMSNYFKGNFYTYTTVPTPTSNVERGIKAYACDAGNYIGLIAMNMLSSTGSTVYGTYNPSSYTIAVNFNSVVPTNSPAACFNFDMGKSFTTFTADIENCSTSLFILDCSTGSVTARYDLKQSDILAPGLSSYTVPNTWTTVSVPSITGSGTVCAGSGNALTLSAPTGTVLGWYRLPDLSTNLGTSSTLAATEGFYQVKMQGTCGSTYNVTGGQVIGSSPFLQLSQTAGVAEYCKGSSASLTASISAGTSCSWTPATDLNTTTGTVVIATPGSDATYTATAFKGSCSSSDQITVIPSPAFGLYVKDDNNDVGTEPNNTSGVVVWNSPHIWVTLSSSTVGPSAHVNADYSDNGEPNYVHVRVSNGDANPQSGVVYLYWVKGGTTSDWSGAWTNSAQAVPATGGQIAGPIPVSVSGGTTSYSDLEVPWYPPNPASYTFDINHFCLLARVITGCPMTYSETSNIWGNTYDNNRIAWRNISVVNTNTANKPVYIPEGYKANLRITNPFSDPTTFRFKITALTNGNGETFFDHGKAKMYMDAGLYSEWQGGGSTSTLVTDLGSNTVRYDSNNGDISNIMMQPDEYFDVDLQFPFSSQANLSYPFEIDITQYNTSVIPEQVVGGYHYVIDPPTCPTVSVANPTLEVCGLTCGNFSVASPNNDASYTWWDSSHSNTVATGTVANVCPTVNTTYWVDEYLDGCLSSAEVTVTIDFSGTCSRMMGPHSASVAPIEQIALAKFELQPNPAADNALVTYFVPEEVKGELMIADSYGRILTRKSLSSSENKTNIDCRAFKNGMYYVSLIYNGRPLRTIKMIVMK